MTRALMMLLLLLTYQAFVSSFTAKIARTDIFVPQKQFTNNLLHQQQHESLLFLSSLPTSSSPSALFSSNEDKNDTEIENRDDGKATVFLNGIVGSIFISRGFVVGYKTNQSLIELLFGGLLPGGLYIWSSFLIQRHLNDKMTKGNTTSDNKPFTLGYKVGTFLSTILTLILGKRWFTYGNFIPSGFMACTTFYTLVCNGLDWLVALTPELGEKGGSQKLIDNKNKKENK